MTLQFSLSAYQAWQRCEQNYSYSYIDKLRPIVKDLAPQRGTMLHEWLATFYREIHNGVQPHNARSIALTQLAEKYQPICNAARQAAFIAGDENLAIQYDDLMASVTRIATHYYHVRGQHDAERYDVLLVEHPITIRIAPGIISTSVIDLVLREKHTGCVWLTEHKTTTSVPDSSVRLRDMQTLLYSQVLAQTTNIHIDGVLWNYLRTKEPVEPHTLKNGGLSRAKDIDTTWTIYKHALVSLGIDPDSYTDMKEKLDGREETVFFPRFEHIIVADPATLMSDYITVAKEVKGKVGKWKTGSLKPVRTLTRDCNWCPYYRLCEAAITGGDIEDVIKMRFRKAGESIAGE